MTSILKWLSSSYVQSSIQNEAHPKVAEPCHSPRSGQETWALPPTRISQVTFVPWAPPACPGFSDIETQVLSLSRIPHGLQKLCDLSHTRRPPLWAQSSCPEDKEIELVAKTIFSLAIFRRCRRTCLMCSDPIYTSFTSSFTVGRKALPELSKLQPYY